MPPPATLPRDLTFAPFRGSDAIQAGLLTRRQLNGNQWRKLFRDIYVAANLPLDHRTWCFAASLLLNGRGAVSGRSAAALFGVNLLRRQAPVEITVSKSTSIRPTRGLTVVRSRLQSGDVQMWAGTPTTTPLRTAFDLARRPPLLEAVVAIDAMLAARLITKADLTRFAAGRPYWPGAGQLRRVLFASDAGSGSPMESRLRLLLVAGGLPWPVTQYEVRTAEGLFVARLDLAYPEHKLGIEYEGDHHRGRGMFQHDLRRLNMLQANGWTVLRFGASDIYRQPRRVIAVVRSALALCDLHE
jgi:hypothetical protein